MVKNVILVSVDVSEWVTPIVPVIRDDGWIRICGCYKLTANQVSQLDNYHITKKDTLFGEISGCPKFAKLYMKRAYQQMLLTESSCELPTINTHWFKLFRLV